MMNKPSLLIVGCGDLGRRVAQTLGQRGWSSTGVRRSPGAVSLDFPCRAADYSIPGSLSFAEAFRPDFVLATFIPSSPTPAGYRRGFTEAAENLLAGLGEHRVKRLIMVSSTRVYAESAGAWVGEAGELSREDERAMAIADAESLLLASDQPVTILRCGGIYGDKAGRLIGSIAGGKIAPEHPVRYTNRFHRDDCAGFLAHLLALSHQNRPLSAIYNGVDDEPAPAHSVHTWLAREMGVQLAADAMDLRKVPAVGKRCSNALLRSTGYKLLYPNFRDGYRRVLGTQ